MICIKCNEEKRPSQFYANCNWCKECYKERAKNYKRQRVYVKPKPLDGFCKTKQAFILGAFTMIQGCALNVGTAIHSNGLDAPEVKLDNPIFIARATKEIGESVTGFCEHHSGIFTREDGLGYNFCGISYKITK